MSFLETVEKARAFLERNGRVSLRALEREFSLDDGALDELIEELVEIQRVAVRDGRALAWAGGVPPALTETSEPERDPRSYTPKHLADKILQSKSALEGERKQVTVLFADVKGSMDLQEGMDPEEWHGIMDRFLQILTEGVHRFEGTVNQYTGDGIMALFGAPIAHEDHAQRACYAALHLTEELRRYATELRRERALSFSVRMGINSGDVVVGKIGDDLRMDYTAQGHTVGLAARMEELAEPGTAYLTEHTAARVEGYFELDNLGEFKLPGSREPLRVHELQRVGRFRTRLDRSRARGFARFVGRADEMQLLEHALAQAEAGTPQVVGIVADAGIGKSRLCFEFLERCRARGVMTYETTGVSHGKATPFLPILRLFREFYGITEQDSTTTTREKIAGRLLLLDESFRDLLPVMFDFLGVASPDDAAPPSDPETRQKQLIAIVRGIIQARAGRETTVTLLEDLHWFDRGSEAFLEPLLDPTPGSRALLLLNSRPEYRATWMQRPNYQQLPLQALGQAAIDELLVDLLGSDPSLAGLAELIQERTEGNPFFIEEVVQSLTEAGSLEGARGAYRLVAPVTDLRVPDTVQAVLAARIDRLPERDKQLLQTAAVIGRKFAEPILAGVAELPEAELATALAALQAADFIFEESLYPEAAYEFKHPLTHDVALGSQLAERRRRIHAAVARAIEERQPDRANEQSGLLAHHWEEAGEDFLAAVWHRRAAEWVGVQDAGEAVRHWRRVRSLLTDLPASPEADRHRLEACIRLLSVGYRLGLDERETEEIVAEGRGLADQLQDTRALVRLLDIHGCALFFFFSDREEGEARFREALGLAESLDDRGLVISLLQRLCIVLLFRGDLRGVLALVEHGLELSAGDWTLGREVIGFSPALSLLCWRGLILCHLSRLEEGAREAKQAERLALEHDDREVIQQARGCALQAALFSGDQAALAHAQRHFEIGEEIGNPLSLLFGYRGLVEAHLLNDDPEAASSAAERFVEMLEPFGEIWVKADLSAAAEALLATGDPERSRSLAAKANDFARRAGHLLPEIETSLALARVRMRTAGRAAEEEVADLLARAAELVEQTGATVFEPHVHLARAELSELLGDDARRELREAHRLFTDMGATGHAERVARELGS